MKNEDGAEGSDAALRGEARAPKWRNPSWHRPRPPRSLHCKSATRRPPLRSLARSLRRRHQSTDRPTDRLSERRPTRARKAGRGPCAPQRPSESGGTGAGRGAFLNALPAYCCRNSISNVLIPLFIPTPPFCLTDRQTPVSLASCFLASLLSSSLPPPVLDFRLVCPNSLGRQCERAREGGTRGQTARPTK